MLGQVFFCGCSFVEMPVIFIWGTSINKIRIGSVTLTGKNVTITDNSHGRLVFEESDVLPVNRPVYSKGPVVIGKNVWIGDKATIFPNV